MMTKKDYIFILALLILGLFIRLYRLDSLPPSLNWDEISLGYNSYSILHTARDEWGQFLPNIFRAYGDFKLPLYIYLSVPFILIFGLNIISIRLLSVLSGVFLPLSVFFLSRQIFPKNKLLPYISSLLVCLSPWSIFLSHIALEANLFLTIFCFSIYFLYRKNFSISLILLAISLFTYNSSRVFLPFYIVFFILNHPKKINLVALLIFFFSILLFLYQTFFASTGQSRYKLVSLIDQGTINRIESRRQSLHPVLTRFIHNKVTYFTFYSFQNYLKIIDPRYLFVNGSTNYQFNIPNYPLIYTLLLPFYIIGLLFLIKNKHSLLFWYLISPLPSAITRDAPHTLRAILFLLISTFITAYGLSLIKNKLIIPILIIFLLFFTSIFYKDFSLYTTKYSWSWQYGYRQVVDYLKDHQSEYQQIYVSKKYGEPHEFINFYYPTDPLTYQTSSQKIWNYHADWYWVDRFHKYIFLNDWEILNSTQFLPASLLITSPGNYPQYATLLKTIYFLDQTPAFDIVKL